MPFRFSSRLAVPFFVLILAGATAPARAQLDKGLMGGWNRSDWVSANAEVDFEPQNGFCAGFYLGTVFSDQWGFRGEVLYTRKGAQSTSSPTDENGDPLGEVDTVFQVDYLEIPLLISFSIPTGGAVRPVFQAGPAVDFQLSAQGTAKYTSGVDIPFDSEQEIQTQTSTDFSLVFSGGIDIDAGAQVINFQIRYVMGLKEIYAQGKNRTLSLIAGFGI